MNQNFTPLQHSVSPSGSPRPLSPLDYSGQFNSQMVTSSTGVNASSPNRKRGGSFQPKLITGDEKYRKKAAHLYHVYKKACLVEQSQQSQTQIYAAGQIYVPPPATSRSAPSRPSKHYSASVSASIFGGSVFGGTDPSSVIDFTGDGSPDSAIGKEGKSVYDGKLVKERRRRNLTPKEKAKAALIRHLKACKSCKERSVGCSIEHHDFSSLPKLVQGSPTSRHVPRSASLSNLPAQASFRQTDVLRGLGQNEQLLITVPQTNSIEMASSPATIDALSNIHSRPIPSRLVNNANAIIAQPPAQPIDGGLFVLGIAPLDGRFVCSFVNPRCSDPNSPLSPEPDACQAHFDTPQELEIHFSNEHFPFTRANPFHKYCCSFCDRQEPIPVNYCTECGRIGTCETRIYGRFIPEPQNLNLGMHLPQGNSFSPSSFQFPGLESVPEAYDSDIWDSAYSVDNFLSDANESFEFDEMIQFPNP